MNIKITGLSAAAAAERKKKASAAGAAGGPSFASFLDEATGASDVPGTAPTLATGTYAPLPSTDDDSQPQPGRKQAGRLLDSLNDLAADTFAGAPTAALHRLKAFLGTTATDRDNLTPQQQQALNEVETRAAVEVAKLTQS